MIEFYPNSIYYPREAVEEKLAKVMAESSSAAARMGSSAVREALLVPARSAKVSLTVKNIMSVNVPSLRYEGGDEELYLLSPRLLAALKQALFAELRQFLSFRLDEREGAVFCEIAEKYVLLQTELPESLKYYRSLLPSAGTPAGV
jgi:hypothetical protein